jgi:hypothetical protein
MAVAECDGDAGSGCAAPELWSKHDADTAMEIAFVSDERAPKRLKVASFGPLFVDVAAPERLALQASVRLLRGCEGLDVAEAERLFGAVSSRLHVESDEQIISVLVRSTKGLRRRLCAPLLAGAGA